MAEKNNQTNLKNAVVDLAKSLETVFKKYSRSTREKAWDKLTSAEGEKEVKKILLDPHRQVNTFQKLANKNESFSVWLERREKKDWIEDAVKKPGSLKKAAKRKKKSVSEYCLNPPSSKAEKRCNLMKTLKRLK